MSWISSLTKGWYLLQHPELWTLDLLLRGLLHPLFFTLFCLAFFTLAGRLAGGRREQYKDRSFFQDLVYWFFYQFGFYDAIVVAAFFSLLDRYAWRADLLGAWPMVPRFLAYWLIVDFMQYWIHRLRHVFRFGWAFHAMHHAEERLSFASQTHVHPIDTFFTALLMYFPVIALGADPLTILPISFLNRLALAAQHSELPWRFGPLYYVFVTPAFHGFHHSADPKHYNKNYGFVLSVWDFLFRTAVDEKQPPAHYGLPDIKMETMSSQMLTPLRLVREWYFKKSPAPAVPEPEAPVTSIH